MILKKEKEKIIYNYITTNSITGEQYVGMHSTSNINDKYIGSGLYIIRAIKKYGRENFNKNILCFCDTREEACMNEAIYIKEYKTLHPFGYNLSPIGGMFKNGVCSEETGRKISEAIKKISRTPTAIEFRRQIMLKNWQNPSFIAERTQYYENKRKKVKKLRMVCPYCDRDVARNNYYLNHGEKCKEKPIMSYEENSFLWVI